MKIVADTDGNTVQIGKDAYVFDALNRPSSCTTYNISAELAGRVPVRRSVWTYDGLNRVRMQIEQMWNATAGMWEIDPANPSLRFVYSGMDVVQERDAYTLNVLTTNTWGVDVSQSMGGAGNVGGLLARTNRLTGGTIQKLYAHHDGRGNVIALTKEGTTLDATAATVARYSYDAYDHQLSIGGARLPYRVSLILTGPECVIGREPRN